MNIFFLDRNIRKCAAYHCDKHVVKMILESTQLLSTALYLNRLTNGLGKNSNEEEQRKDPIQDTIEKSVQRSKQQFFQQPTQKIVQHSYSDLVITKAYKPCHTKHPSTLWTASSPKHWLYLWYLCAALNEEYKFRYHDREMDEITMKNIFDKNEEKVNSIDQIKNTSYDYNFHNRNLLYFSQNKEQSKDYNHTSFNVAIEIFSEILHTPEDFQHFITAFTSKYNSRSIYHPKYRSTYRSSSANHGLEHIHSIHTHDWTHTDLDKIHKDINQNTYKNIDGKIDKSIHKNTHKSFNPNNDPGNHDTNPNFVDPPQAMPDQYKHDDAVVAYRKYYLGEKMTFAKWKKRNIPEWINV